MKSKTMQHFNPIWKDQADFIIGVKLPITLENYDAVWEQLWSKRVSEKRFKVCCIPFFAKDISLGDEVETDANFMVNRVILASRQYTFRVWFGDSKENDIRSILIEEMRKNGCLLEWYSDNLMAISCSENYAQIVADILFEKQNLGKIYYETGKTV